jgi:hypothetical protein
MAQVRICASLRNEREQNLCFGRLARNATSANPIIFTINTKGVNLALMPIANDAIVSVSKTIGNGSERPKMALESILMKGRLKISDS